MSAIGYVQRAARRQGAPGDVLRRRRGPRGRRRAAPVSADGEHTIPSARATGPGASSWRPLATDARCSSNGEIYDLTVGAEAARRAARGRAEFAQLTAPMPATVIKVLVEAGAARQEGRHAPRARGDEDGAAVRAPATARSRRCTARKASSCSRRRPRRAGMTTHARSADAASPIVEVGPRDGLQNERAPIATADKIAFVDRLSDARLPVIEVSAFVSPKWVPQMADAAKSSRGIARRAGHALHRARAEPRRPRPRARGRRRRDRDLRRLDRDLQPQEHQPEHRRVARHLRAGRRTARGPPGCACAAISRPRSAARSKATSRRRASPRSPRALIDLGVFEVAVSDTIGVAHPGQVPRVLDAVLARLRVDQVALHFHDTRGTALANVLAALPARHRDVRRLGRRPRRLSVRAGRGRQPRHRRL